MQDEGGRLNLQPSPWPFRALGNEDGAARGLHPTMQSRASEVLGSFQNWAEGTPFEVSSFSTWAIHQLQALVEPVVDPVDYVQLSFLPRGAAVTRIQHDSAESLRDPVSSEDLDYCLDQLPYKSTQGPDRFPFELLKGAPDAFKETLGRLLNSALVRWSSVDPRVRA